MMYEVEAKFGHVGKKPVRYQNRPCYRTLRGRGCGGGSEHASGEAPSPGCDSTGSGRGRATLLGTGSDP